MFIYCIINFIKEIRIEVDHITILLIGESETTKTSINKKDNEQFQYAVTVVVNLEGIGKHA